MSQLSSSNSTSGQASQTRAGRRRKRPHPPVYGGIMNSFSDKNSDFVCPICFDTIDEAFMTKCGHTFCYQCITRSLEESNRCPKCNYIIDKPDQIFPNFLLNELVQKVKERTGQKKTNKMVPDTQLQESGSALQEILA